MLLMSDILAELLLNSFNSNDKILGNALHLIILLEPVSWIKNTYEQSCFILYVIL